MPPEPLPRHDPATYRPVVWPAGDVVRLLPRGAPLPVDMVSVMEQRQSRRGFTRPVGQQALGEFLWMALRSRTSRASKYGPDQESRPHPSAGAMHPIHVLLGADGAPWRRYDPVEHVLIELPGSNGSAALARHAANELLDVDCGLVLALVAEPGKTAAKYINPESLIWRDAGVVLGYMSVVAEVLGLSFCPLGITGNPQVGDLLRPPARLFGVGVAVLGA